MVKTIDAEELKKKLDRDEDLVVVNVLNEDEFEKVHIPGSINIPVEEEFEKEVKKQLPNKDQEIIVHCSSMQCQGSSEAVEKLENLGYKNVVEFEGGIKEWLDKDFPVISKEM